jgi:hypothetical protein
MTRVTPPLCVQRARVGCPPCPPFCADIISFPLAALLPQDAPCASCLTGPFPVRGRQPPLSSSAIMSPLPIRTVKEIGGDGGMDDQEVVPPVLSQHQLELCLRCPKALACHLAGAGSGGIGLIHNRSISLLHLMPPGNGNMFPDQVVVTPPPSSTSYSPACNAPKHCPVT